MSGAPVASAEPIPSPSPPATSASASISAASVPSVTGVSPARGRTAGKTVVTLTGQGFSGAKRVAFGTNIGSRLTIISDTKLQVAAPAGKGTVPVRVTTKAGATSPKSGKAIYRYVSAPTVAKVSPKSGSADGKTSVTITGKNFVDVTGVRFGNAPGTDIRVISEKKLVVSTPAHAAGTVYVRVATAHGTSPKTTHGKFSFAAGPTVREISPTSGPEAGGTTVTITGSGFTELTQVTFGGVPGTNLNVISSRKLTVTTPPRKDGVVDVLVTGRYGTSQPTTATRYTYTPACARTVIEVSGEITEDTTWKAGCGIVYHITGAVLVEGSGPPRLLDPAKLTIQAGTIVKFDDGASLVAAPGWVVVEGTSENPVIFTSIDDDTASGDTNNNGDRTKPKARSWGGVVAQANAGVIRINSLDMRYGGDITGGYGGGMIGQSPSTVRVTNSTLFQSGSILAKIFFEFVPYDPVLIVGNTLTSSGTISVAGQAAAENSVPIQVTDNTVIGSDSSEPAFSVVSSRLQPSLLTGNTGRDNKVNAFRIHGTLVENWTLSTTGLPYIVGAPWRLIGAPGDADGLNVDKGVTLTVPAGAVLKFQRVTVVYPEPLTRPAPIGISGDGTLVVKGTAAKPVVFTSIHDDTVGGDTNGDGDATKPAAGDWDGLAIRETGTLEATFLDIRYA
ncbi:MAG: IPT/TIG domain-containing protein [Micropruina sp.]|uniref:IPT/TIG domain-containing protein n=1 Tax=Micropruina sp. TaxID=2737536 RepID=UPI0039E56072